MAKKQMTPWFPGTVPPARDGVYETHNHMSFARFEGGRWFFQCFTKRSAAAEKRLSPNAKPAERWTDGYKWRGLASAPKGKA
jgi:hypothetical protein